MKFIIFSLFSFPILLPPFVFPSSLPPSLFNNLPIEDTCAVNAFLATSLTPSIPEIRACSSPEEMVVLLLLLLLVVVGNEVLGVGIESKVDESEGELKLWVF